MAKTSKHKLPDNVEKEIEYTNIPFSSLTDLLEWFKAIKVDKTTKVLDSSRTYDDLLHCSNVGEDMALSEFWCGNPVPRDYAEVLSRNRYQNMDEYTRVYNTVIKPMVQQILQDSKAIFELPTLRYNDRGLGSFDFAKASISLVPIYKYWSIKKEEFVEGIDVITYKEGGKFKTKLKSDNSPVVTVPKVKNSNDEEVFEKVKKAYKEIYEGAQVFPTLKKYDLKIGGKNSITSTIKKCYIAKEKFPRPKNAVRIFINIGCNSGVSGEEYKWTGYTAIGILELLTLMGYSVSLIGIWSDERNGIVKGVKQPVARSFSATIKKFEETVDAPSLLYFFSDVTYFRGKVFEDIIKSAYYYKDNMNCELGSISAIRTVKNIVYDSYGKRDKLFNKAGAVNKDSQFIYFIIGDIHNESEMTEEIKNMAFHIVDENLQARMKMGIIDEDLQEKIKNLGKAKSKI